MDIATNRIIDTELLGHETRVQAQWSSAKGAYS